MIYRFAIIGAGLTGTSLLCQLVDGLETMEGAGRLLGSRLAVEIFERHAVAGPGLPHNSAHVLPFHLTNMCARDMTVRVSRPDDFQKWVEANREDLSRRFERPEFDYSIPGGPDAQCAHYPRAVMGEYLKNQLDEARKRAEKLGSRIDMRCECEVIDLWMQGTEIYLTFDDHHNHRQRAGPYHGALLATGHWFESSRIDNYFSSPWPAAGLRDAIPPGARVGVIGSSLSAIETALTLSADGCFQRLPCGRLNYETPDAPRRLTLYSRHGLVPRVRGRVGTRPNRYFTCERLRELMAAHPGTLSLAPLFQLLDRELAAAYGSGIDWQQVLEPAGTPADALRRDIDRALQGDGPDGELVWQTILVQVFPVVRELYLALSSPERRRFDREFTTLFFAHAATQPAINAEKLLALMEAGVVEIKRLGREYRFGHNASTRKFEFSYTGADGQGRCDSFAFCVDARGQPRSVETDSSPLTRNLLARGLVRVEGRQSAGGGRGESPRAGSILIDPGTHLVVQPGHDGQDGRTPQLFAVGAMTRGQMIDSSMAFGLARSTETVARLLIERMSEL